MGIWSWIKAWTADGGRDAMRQSYWKHRRLAEADPAIASEWSPHDFGLFCALATRYQLGALYDDSGYSSVTAMPPEVRNKLGNEDMIAQVRAHADLSLFALMREAEAIEAIAEYIVWQERPRSARERWLRETVNMALLQAIGSEEQPEALGACAMIYQERGAPWTALVDAVVAEQLQCV